MAAAIARWSEAEGWWDPKREGYYNRSEAVKRSDRQRWGKHRFSPEEFCDRLYRPEKLTKDEGKQIYRIADLILDPMATTTQDDVALLQEWGYLKVGEDRIAPTTLSRLARNTRTLIRRGVVRNGRRVPIIHRLPNLHTTAAPKAISGYRRNLTRRI